LQLEVENGSATTSIAVKAILCTLWDDVDAFEGWQCIFRRNVFEETVCGRHCKNER